MAKISALPVASPLIDMETVPLEQARATQRVPLDLLTNPELDPVFAMANAMANAMARQALGAEIPAGHMGSFNGATIPDGLTAKQVMAVLENAHEAFVALLAAGPGSRQMGHTPRGTGAQLRTLWDQLERVEIPVENYFNGNMTNGDNVGAAVQKALDVAHTRVSNYGGLAIVRFKGVYGYNCSLLLDPGDTFTIVYSSAPTVRRKIHVAA